MNNEQHILYKTVNIFYTDTYMYSVIDEMVLNDQMYREGYLAYEDTKKKYAKYKVKFNCQYENYVEFIVTIVGMLTGGSDCYNVVRDKKDVYDRAFNVARPL